MNGTNVVMGILVLVLIGLILKDYKVIPYVVLDSEAIVNNSILSLEGRL